MCCDAFPNSTTRPQIMDGLEKIINTLIANDVIGEVWVDGSFLTEKINPADSDILVYFSGDFYDNGTLQQRHLIDTINTNLKAQFMCDSYVLPYYSQGHQWYNILEERKAYWTDLFGTSRSKIGKGMAVVKLIK